ncbi:RND superfamily putative drug exporter [Bacillus ectoiniformans]|uniref:MMPL family transporter n=1 Tax=Bacillus ectoiniformans TaxID=1494429 RepID=UPI00195BA7A0|nr:MMPL family transporter [Bacillus ectoiniformans]MBM7648712.1 RND superfamily putative drug exporter [Bacillus ectoiniformans]
MLSKISSSIVRFPKTILFIWILAVGIMGYFATQLPSLLEGDGFRTDGEYEQVQKELGNTFDFPESTLFVLFEKNKQSDQAFTNQIQETLKEIEDLKLASDIQSPLQDPALIKEDSAYALIHFNESIDEMSPIIADMKKITEKESGVTLTGAPVISEDINKASQDDLKRAELIGLPVALVVLLFAFGTVVASILPLIVGAVTIIIAFGVLTFIGKQVDLAIFILNIAPMVGLALSIDFSLLFINRFKEELEKQSKEKALITAIHTAGHSILFSAVCVFIGLGAMLVIDIDIFKNVAIGGMVVILIAVLGSLTLLPALLYLAGSSINKWRIIRTDRSSNDRWRTFSGLVMKRPVIVALTAIAILVAGILPVKDMNLSIPTFEALPKSFDSRTAFEKIEKEFMQENKSTVYVIAEREGGWLNEDGLKQMKELEDSFTKNDKVTEVDSLFSISKMTDPKQLTASLEQPQVRSQLDPAIDQFIQKDQLLLPVHLNVEASSDAAQDLMRSWKEQDWPVDLMFGGQPKFNQEIYDEIYDKVGLAVAIILISTFFILMLAFRSIIIPLKAIIMNVVGLTSTFGILVWVFQGGHFGLHESDISLVLPVLVFSLVFGLSMDYEVFLISRIREYYLQTGDNTYSTVEGLANTSKIITSAALIMIVITGAFAFTGIVPVKQIGIGIAVAIAIDATIIRLLLVPSLMKLLGDWNWWFPFGSRKKRSLEHE